MPGPAAPPLPAHLRRRTVAASVLASASFGVWLLALWFRPTILVTPIDGLFHLCCCAIGVIAALWITLVIARYERHRAIDDVRYRQHPRARIALMGFVTTVFGVLIGSDAAYVLTDLREFGGSDMPVAWADFPIRGVQDEKGGASADIGSAGERHGPALSRYERRFLGKSGRFTRPWQWCLPLRRQATWTAVRVWPGRTPRLTDHRIRIVRCLLRCNGSTDPSPRLNERDQRRLVHRLGEQETLIGGAPLGRE